MSKVDMDFLIALQDAIIYIDANGFDVYVMTHWNDPYYWQIVETLIQQLDRKMDPVWGLPPDSTGWTIDQLCQWYILNNYDFTIVNLPAVFADYWNYNMEARRADGVYKRRSPFTIKQPNTPKQQAVREIFLKARDCFQKQWGYHLITNPSTGYKSRGHWFNAAISSGLYYYTYFMQETLRVMFGPEEHDKFPFAGEQTPDWCVECNQAEQWEYTPLGVDDFIFSLHTVSLPEGNYSQQFSIAATGDPDSPTPGDPAVLKVELGIQGMDSESEPTGPLATYLYDPIGTGWNHANFGFVAGAATTAVYISVLCNNGDGDYLLYFRNAQQNNFVSDPQLHINGASGDSFNWEVGSGDFSFKAFVSV